MELLDKYKDGKTTFSVNGFKVRVVNDPSQFQHYKNLGLNVFKKKRKKSDTSTDERPSE